MMKFFVVLIFSLVCLLDVHAETKGFIRKGFEWNMERTKRTEPVYAVAPHVLVCWESGASTIIAPNGNEYDFTDIRNKGASRNSLFG